MEPGAAYAKTSDIEIEYEYDSELIVASCAPMRSMTRDEENISIYPLEKCESLESFGLYGSGKLMFFFF